MLITTTKHHEQFVILPLIGSAVTFVYCWIQMKIDLNKLDNQESNKTDED